MPRKQSLRTSAFALGLTTITAFASTLPLDLGAQTSNNGRSPGIIDRLNDCVQERFKEVDERLGTARVARPGAPHLFAPERMRDVAIVEELERARLQVVLYLAGREVLKPKPDYRFPPAYISEEYFTSSRLLMAPRRIKPGDAIEWGVIKGPIRVTTVQKSAGDSDRPPAASELWDEARGAMHAFADAERREFARGSWSFAARPVRVTDQACLNCHTLNGATLMSAGIRPDNPLQVGDAIGVLLYGYKNLR